MSVWRSDWSVWKADWTAEEDRTPREGGVVEPLPSFKRDAVRRKIGSFTPPRNPSPPPPNIAPGPPPRNEPRSAIPGPVRPPLLPLIPENESRPKPRRQELPSLKDFARNGALRPSVKAPLARRARASFNDTKHDIILLDDTVLGGIRTTVLALGRGGGEGHPSPEERFGRLPNRERSGPLQMGIEIRIFGRHGRRPFNNF